MGQELLALSGQEPGWNVTTVARDGWCDILPIDVDVVVDFSMPDGFSKTLDWCLDKRKPLVSGTTGLSRAQIESMEAAAKDIPILWSANMSLGVHVLARALKSLQALKGWDFQIEETHHRFKKDKPSGTAIFLQNELEKIVGEGVVPRPLSIRGGGVIGIHRVDAMALEETLRFEHQAVSRSVFARGALTAASWLAKRKGKANLYTIADVLAALEES
jgi:4-hydroxy-tetrahydrodipicolinate reductase